MDAKITTANCEVINSGLVTSFNGAAAVFGAVLLFVLHEAESFQRRGGDDGRARLEQG